MKYKIMLIEKYVKNTIDTIVIAWSYYKQYHTIKYKDYK